MRAVWMVVGCVLGLARCAAPPTACGRREAATRAGAQPARPDGFMVSQEVPYPGKRDLRGAIANREADAQLQDVDAARFNIIARVKQAYYRLGYTYSATDVLRRCGRRGIACESGGRGHPVAAGSGAGQHVKASLTNL